MFKIYIHINLPMPPLAALILVTALLLEKEILGSTIDISTSPKNNRYHTQNRIE